MKKKELEHILELLLEHINRQTAMLEDREWRYQRLLVLYGAERGE